MTTLPTMVFEKQKFLHVPEDGIVGDCWRTAIAALLGLARDDVPHVHFTDHRLSENIHKFLTERGMHLIRVGISGSYSVDEALAIASTWSDQPFMFVGESRTGVNHAVIAHDGKIIHDPSLTNSGIIGPRTDEPHVYLAEWIVQFPARLQ